MKSPVIHSHTKRLLENYIAAPAHAVLLTGAPGIGKRTLAQYSAARILHIDDYEDYPYALTLRAPDDRAIGIGAVRELEQFLALKVPGKHTYDRIVIIEDAHLLTVEAQNALLKTLEEPPQGSLLVLTATQSQALLPTIRSRVQVLPVQPPVRSDLETFFAAHPATTVAQAYAMSGGLPGLMNALLNDNEHPLRLAVQQARSLLGQTTFERLTQIDTLVKQREAIINLTFILQQMAHVSLQTAQGAAAQRWQTILTASYKASEAIANYAQPKLVLTDLFLAI